MQTEDILIVDRADIDMICESCGKQITVGEDYYYDTIVEEVHCEKCSLDQDNF